MKYKWFIALILSLIFGLNHLIGFSKTQNYTPFALTGVSKGGSFDEAYCYVPSINAVRFNKPLGDWQAFEYRLGPKIQPTLGPSIFGRIAQVVGLENLYIIADFIFPPLVFLTFYYLVKLITKNELLSVLAPLVLIGKEPLQSFVFKLGVSLVKYKEFDYFINYLNNLNRPLNFARFDSPQFSFIILTLGLIMFFKAIKSRRVIFYCLAGFLFGLQWYIYSYYAVFLALVLGSSFGIFLIQKDRRLLKFSASAIFSLIITSALYWSNYFRFMNLPQAMDFFLRAGRIDGRWFDAKSLEVIFFALVLLLIGSKIKKHRQTIQFLVILLLAAFLCLNLQLLSGFSVQHFHWQSVIIMPVLIITIFFLLSLLKLSQRIRQVFGFLIVLLLTAIFFRNLLIAINTSDSYIRNNDFEQAYSWINQNLELNSVIMTPSLESNYWLIIKTKLYVFNPHGLHTLAPTKEIVNRFALTFSLFNVNKNFINQFLDYRPTPGIQPHTHESLDLAGYDYIFDTKFGLFGPLSVGAQTEITQAKTSLLTIKTTWSQARKQYRLDYIFVGPAEKNMSKSDFAGDKNLIKVFDNQTIQIYKLVD